MEVKPSFEVDQAQLAVEQVLGSATFARSDQLRSFLRYVCERTLAGHGKDNSFVAAWRQMEGGFRLESAFIMLSELSPVALAYRKREPDLYWTACWQCPGQGGHVSLREDGRIVIVQD